MAPVSSKAFLDIEATIECIYSETCTWHNNIQSNAPYRLVLATQLNHLGSLAKWLSVLSWTKQLWVRIPILSLILININICKVCNITCCLCKTYQTKCSWIIWPIKDRIFSRDVFKGRSIFSGSFQENIAFAFIWLISFNAL